jgi:predicted nucleic acid-binding Zn ribbon protein
MPIYVYKCKSCGFEREILRRTVGKPVIQELPEKWGYGCPEGHGPLHLVVGRGVIARFGVQWMQKNMIDRGQVRLPGREPGDLGIATEQNLKRKYARHIAENPA